MVHKKPLFCLFVDKMSAFDLVLKQHVILADFEASGGVENPSQISIYLSNRLGNRETFLQYGQTIMGPIRDTTGVEQGGVPSSEEFQLVENQ